MPGQCSPVTQPSGSTAAIRDRSRAPGTRQVVSPLHTHLPDPRQASGRGPSAGWGEPAEYGGSSHGDRQERTSQSEEPARPPAPHTQGERGHVSMAAL